VKNRVGLVSLVVTSTGLLITQIGIHFGILSGVIWNLLSAGFEAGTVGGLADWFAVSALFHEIPIPIVRKHTNIIVKNRRQLTEGVTDLVTNRWLSPEVIKSKLDGVKFSNAILRLLNEPQNQTKGLDFLRDILSRFSESIDSREVAAVVSSILRDQIQGIDIGTPLGRWLEGSIKRGEHNQLWDMILDSAQKSINDSSTRQMLKRKVQEKIEEYKNEGLFKRLITSGAEMFGGLDPDSVVSKLISSMNEFVNEARGNPGHPVRSKFDNQIVDFAIRLSNGDVDAHRTVNEWKKRLVENANLEEMIQGMLARFKGSIVSQLNSNDSPLMSLFATNLKKVLVELQQNPGAQERLDIWIRNTATELINRYHHEIGNMVRASLSKLDNKSLVDQIEEKVGNDLQYIRLNGAVVGGLAGLMIALLKHVFAGL
jgi:uncharacterized membrane-anchored protein YjiN (DUF445 family)